MIYTGLYRRAIRLHQRVSRLYYQCARRDRAGGDLLPAAKDLEGVASALCRQAERLARAEEDARA